MSVLLLALQPEEVSAEQRAQVEALAQGRQVVITNQPEEMEPLLEEIEIAAASFPVALLARAPALRWYQQWGAGTDWLLRHPEIARRDFLLTNASGVHAINISEHIFALMLAFSRCLHKAFRAQAARQWTHNMGAFELAGQTMLLIGVGAIGKRTALLAEALGMNVIGVRRGTGKRIPGVARMARTAELPELLPQADFIVLTIPHTKETHHLLDQEAFARMKPSAYLINIGRGATVDEAALIEALRSGQIAGAGLDVFETEPLPESSPLWAMENVIITAHFSGETPHYHERAMAIFLDNLERFAKGKPLKNLVDKERGY